MITVAEEQEYTSLVKIQLIRRKSKDTIGPGGKKEIASRMAPVESDGLCGLCRVFCGLSFIDYFVTSVNRRQKRQDSRDGLSSNINHDDDDDDNNAIKYTMFK